MCRFIQKVIVYTLSIISVLIMMWLTIASMNATVKLSEYEQRYYCKDNLFINILFVLSVVLVTSAVQYIFHGKLIINENMKKYVVTFVLIIYGVVLFVITTNLKIIPTYDQYKVYNIAGQLINRDFTQFLVGGYGERWTNQWGYILFLMVQYKIFGMRNLDALYLVNVLFIVGIAWEMYRFSCKFLKKSSIVILIYICLFVPIWSYATFTYGNVPSFYFFLLSINLLKEFLDNKGITKGILSALFMSLSIVLKTTSVLLLLAYIIYILIGLFSEKKGKETIQRIAIIFLVIVMYMLSGRLVHHTMEHMTGMKLGDGIPRIAHIAMGMHENGRGSGWYDGYVASVYEDNDFDYEKTELAAKRDLAESISRFKSSPSNMIGFFSRKSLSQWIEPTYESIFILYNRNLYSDGLLFNLNELQINRVGAFLNSLLDIMQSVIYCGAFIYFSMLTIGIKQKYKNSNSDKDVYLELIDELLVGLILIGAFLFYLMWEAKSQYSLLFAYLLLPVAVVGYNKVNEYIVSLLSGECKNSGEYRATICGCFIIGIALVTGIVPEDSNLGRLVAPTWSETAYDEYLRELQLKGVSKWDVLPIDEQITATIYDNNGKARFPAGRYLIFQDGKEKCLCTLGEESGMPLVIRENSENLEHRVILTSTNKGYTFRFQNSQLVMDVDRGLVIPGTKVQQWEWNGDPSQIFKFVEASEGEYYISYVDDLVLEATEDGSVVIDKLDKNNRMQLWRIESE